MRFCFVIPITLLLATRCLPQATPPTSTYEKSIEWVSIQVPTFPPIARAARILGTVAIEVRFKGCALDPESLHVISGPPMLQPAALTALQHSTVSCGDFQDSKATVYYEFGDYIPQKRGCDPSFQRVETIGNRVRVLATMTCAEP